jgi:hypothetical protein
MDFDIIYQFIAGGDYTTVRPTLEEVLSANIIVVSVLIFILFLIIIGKYGIGEKVFGKGKGWKAIIPFYGFFQLFRAVGVAPVLSLLLFIPVIGYIPMMVFGFALAKAFNQRIDMQLFTALFPCFAYPLFGFGNYEFQYVKGRNTAFTNDFRTMMPEDLLKDAATPASIMNDGVIAKESMVSRAATAAAEQTRLIRKAQEEAEAARLAEEAKKQEAAEKEKQAKQAQDEYRYDIFSNNDESNLGPTSSDINFGDFKLVNGRFQSYVPTSVVIPPEQPTVQPPVIPMEQSENPAEPSTPQTNQQ